MAHTHDEPPDPGSQPLSGVDTTESEGGESEDDGQVQYYSRSVLPHREVALHRFSLRRKSTLIAISLLAALILSAAGAFSATQALNQLEQQSEDNSERFAYLAPGIIDDAYLAPGIIDDARTRILALAAGATAALMVTIFIIVRAGPRIVALEFWIRRMGAGDLTYRVRPAGTTR